MKYRKKGIYAEPISDTEKSVDEMFKELGNFFEDEFAKVYHWGCPKCSFSKILLKSMVDDVGIITCPVCGAKETMFKVRHNEKQ